MTKWSISRSNYSEQTSGLIQKGVNQRRLSKEAMMSSDMIADLEAILEKEKVPIYAWNDVALQSAAWQTINEHPHYSLANVAVRHSNGDLDIGVVRSDRSGKLLSQCVYGKSKKVMIKTLLDVHRLMIDTFVGNKPTGERHTIDHINRHYFYSIASNLRWATGSVQRTNQKARVGHVGARRSVIRTHIATGQQETFDSISSAVENVKPQDVTMYLAAHRGECAIRNGSHRWGYSFEYTPAPPGVYRNVPAQFDSGNIGLKVSEEGGYILWPSGKYTKGQISATGYHVVNFSGKVLQVHRMICAAFHGDLEQHQVVDHIDGVRTNNDASNLRPCTRRDNMLAAIQSGKRYLRAVQQFDKTGTTFLRTFTSVSDACKDVGAHHANIRNACLGKPGCNTSKGFVWRYVD